MKHYSSDKGTHTHSYRCILLEQETTCILLNHCFYENIGGHGGQVYAFNVCRHGSTPPEHLECLEMFIRKIIWQPVYQLATVVQKAEPEKSQDEAAGPTLGQSSRSRLYNIIDSRRLKMQSSYRKTLQKKA